MCPLHGTICWCCPAGVRWNRRITICIQNVRRQVVSACEHCRLGDSGHKNPLAFYLFRSRCSLFGTVNTLFNVSPHTRERERAQAKEIHKWDAECGKSVRDKCKEKGKNTNDKWQKMRDSQQRAIIKQNLIFDKNLNRSPYGPSQAAYRVVNYPA